MQPIPLHQISYAFDQAAHSTGLSRDVIMRAVRSGDLVVHYPEIDGRAISKPVIYADDLRAWILRSPTVRAL